MTSYLRYQKELRIVQDADDIESWITVRGNHIPIKKGQSKEEAVKAFIGNKSDKSLSERANKPQTLGEGLKKVVNQTKKNKELYEASGVGKKEKWSGAWSKRANKPVTLGEAAKTAVEIIKKEKELNEAKQQQYKDDLKWFGTGKTAKQRQEAGYSALEIAYNMEFGKNAAKNRSNLIKEVHNSGVEDPDYIEAILNNMEEKHFESQESFRKGIRLAKKSLKPDNKNLKGMDSWNKLWGKK